MLENHRCMESICLKNCSYPWQYTRQVIDWNFVLRRFFYAPEGLGAVFSLTDISCVWCELHCL